MTLPGLDALRSGLHPDARVDHSVAARTVYGRDSWPYLTLKVRAGDVAPHRPDVVVTPATPEDVVHVIAWATQHRVPLVPFGAGSGVAGAALATRGGVILDMKRFDELDTSWGNAGLAYVGAGWVGARLEHELNRQGLSLGHFPSSIGCSTVGGYLATRSAGQLSTRHGKIEDMVVSVRYVDASGQVRESAESPHDETALLVGSEGTMGVILGAWLRVEARPVHRRARGFAAPDVATGLQTMRHLLQAGHRPSVLRLYDEFDTFISGARKAGVPQKEAAIWREALAAWNPRGSASVDARGIALRLANGLLSRTFGGPLALNQLADRVYDSCLLIVGVEEVDEGLVEASAADVFGAVSDHVQDLGPGPGAHWYENRHAVSYKMSPLIDAGLFVDTMEVAAPWSRLHELYTEVKRALAGRVFIMAHFSHGYVCGGSIYFTFAGFSRDAADAEQTYRTVWAEAMRAVHRVGGAVTHHHGVGVLKASHLECDQSGGGSLYQAARSTLDPHDILNPGKLWHVEGHFA